MIMPRRCAPEAHRGGVSKKLRVVETSAFDRCSNAQPNDARFCNSAAIMRAEPSNPIASQFNADRGMAAAVSASDAGPVVATGLQRCEWALNKDATIADRRGVRKPQGLAQRSGVGQAFKNCQLAVDNASYCAVVATHIRSIGIASIASFAA